MSPEDRQKLRQLREQMQSASPEEREKLQKQSQDLMAKAGVTYTLMREGNAKYGEKYNGIHYADKFLPRTQLRILREKNFRDGSEVQIYAGTDRGGRAPRCCSKLRNEGI